MATRAKANIPFLINDSGVIVGYVDDRGIERTIDGAPIIPGTTPPSGLVLAQSAVAASVTGTTNETTLATIAIPAGAMGVNGSLRITTLWTTTNSANNKNLRVKLGATAFTDIALTTTAAGQFQTHIRNRGAPNSQVAFIVGSGFPFASSAGSPFPGAIDTAVSQTLALTGQLANTGETITLEAYTVEILNP